MTGDIDRATVYVSLAPGTEHPAGMDPPVDELLHVTDTPAVTKRRTGWHRPPTTRWPARGRWLWSHLQWKQCLQDQLQDL